MKRRTFLNEAALTVGAAALSRWPLQAAQGSANASDASDVKRVLIAFSCHLDVGFTDTQAKVVKLYFDRYFPQAIQTAAKMRATGQNRYIWTSGSWLVYEYLEQANAEQRRQMEQAIAAGDFAWHALPFNWQSEVLDRSMMDGCLGFAAALDQRFGKKTTGAKMSDVPGHSRGIISALAAAGVQLLDIGVNSASTPPEVPEAFLWKNPDGSSVVMLYHHHAYGGVIRIPKSDVAIAVEIRNDNGGPHSPKEIETIYAELRKQFPAATVQAATFSDIAGAVHAARETLPVVTDEIGDTWIYGVPSDPYKVAQYRELGRLRKTWIQGKQMSVGDQTDRKLLAQLSLGAEHTWGTDTKRYIDYNHYKPKDLQKVLNTAGYQVMIKSWQEKRNDIDAGIPFLPAKLKEEATNQLRALRATTPSKQGLKAHAINEPLDTPHFTIALDPKTGAIITLRSKASGRDWASADHPLALFTYQTLSKANYDAFLNTYVKSKQWWAPRDFGKPNIEHLGAVSRDWHPSIVGCWANDEKTRALVELRIDDAASERAGCVAWPHSMYVELGFPGERPVVNVTLLSLDKQANRMPEAMWMTFHPQVNAAKNWRMDKIDQEVSPFEVVRGGGRRMHAVTDRLRCKDEKGVFELITLDAPTVAVGERSPLNFSLDLPTMQEGFHVNLFNNAWGTNYPQWAGGDWMFRFQISAS